MSAAVLTPSARTRTLDRHAALGGVAEGAATASALLARAAKEESAVDLPICAAVANLLDGRLGLAEAVSALLARPRRDE